LTRLNPRSPACIFVKDKDFDPNSPPTIVPSKRDDASHMGKTHGDKKFS